MRYQLVVLLHLAGVTVFFGNFLLAFFWKAQAERSADPAIVAHTFRGLMVGDRWLTASSVLAIVASGVGAALLAGLPILSTGWIFWSLAAFALSGVVFLVRVLPLQRALAGWTSAAAARPGFDWPRYRREAGRWSRWAHASLACALVAFVLMAAKPALPGLDGLLDLGAGARSAHSRHPLR
jgi:uncharacterized membrane protein